MKIDTRLRTSILVFSLVGLIDSLYLSWIKFAHREAYCLPGIGDCETVNTSRYSEIFGIPIAVFGGLFFVLICALCIFEGRRFLSFTLSRDLSKTTIFGFSLFGLLYSAYLTYIEIAVLRAVCPFCVISAVAVLLIFVLSLSRLGLNQS